MTVAMFVFLTLLCFVPWRVNVTHAGEETTIKPHYLLAFATEFAVEQLRSRFPVGGKSQTPQ